MDIYEIKIMKRLQDVTFTFFAVVVAIILVYNGSSIYVTCLSLILEVMLISAIYGLLNAKLISDAEDDYFELMYETLAYENNFFVNLIEMCKENDKQNKYRFKTIEEVREDLNDIKYQDYVINLFNKRGTIIYSINVLFYNDGEVLLTLLGKNFKKLFEYDSILYESPLEMMDYSDFEDSTIFTEIDDRLICEPNKLKYIFEVSKLIYLIDRAYTKSRVYRLSDYKVLITKGRVY